MSTKRYTAETWEDALRLVKEDLGDDAVILHSKQYKEGGVMGVGQRNVVEITASNDAIVVQSKQERPARAQASGQASQSSEPSAPEGSADESPKITQADPGDGKPNYSQLLEKAYALASTRSEAVSEQEASAAPDTPEQPKPQAFNPPPSEAAPAPSQQSQRLFPKPGGEAQVAKDEQIASLTNDVAELKALVAKLASGAAPGASGVAELSDAVQDLYRRLTDADVSAERSRDIARTVARELSGDALDDPRQVQDKALQVVERMIQVSGPISVDHEGTSVIAMIGPTGVGKTTTLSKLAANLIINRRDVRVGFVTIDTYRLGATEQLRTLANVLNVPVRVVMTPKEMQATVKEMSANLDAIFIDTAGRSQRDRMKMNELRTFLEACQPTETHLCVSATTHPVHLMASLDQFGGLPVDRLILTKLDEASTYGSALDVVMRARLPLSYLTVGQDIPDDIELASGDRLARLLLGVDVLDG